MRRWKHWRLVAVGRTGKSARAEMSRISARDWNSDPTTPRFWTQRGANRAAAFFSTTLPCEMRVVRDDNA